MTTPTDAEDVERMAQAVAAFAGLARTSHQQREILEQAAAMLRALLWERDDARESVCMLDRGIKYHKQQAFDARAAALEEAADEAKIAQNAYIRAQHGGEAEACGEIERTLRALATQARQDSAA